MLVLCPQILRSVRLTFRRGAVPKHHGEPWIPSNMIRFVRVAWDPETHSAREIEDPVSSLAMSDPRYHWTTLDLCPSSITFGSSLSVSLPRYPGHCQRDLLLKSLLKIYRCPTESTSLRSLVSTAAKS